ncbi:unnamed protein product [Polarella glacialis]|uniref:Uncharacterized protein n=1 Tax=Polarella glacialis TaxID=89957 RepID=A0A813ED75_POLGL|nr:unnamed protein product [Polarella glacialis]
MELRRVLLEGEVLGGELHDAVAVALATNAWQIHAKLVGLGLRRLKAQAWDELGWDEPQRSRKRATPSVLHDAVLDECCQAMKGKVPSKTWIRGWLQADRQANVNVRPSHHEFPGLLTPLEVLSHSKVGGAALRPVVGALVKRGARARGEYIIASLHERLQDEESNKHWRALWAKAASTQLSWAVQKSALQEHKIILHECTCRETMIRCHCPELDPLGIQISALVAALLAGVITDDVIATQHVCPERIFHKDFFPKCQEFLGNDAHGSADALSWLMSSLDLGLQSGLQFAGVVVDTGSLLERFAASRINITVLLEPVAFLVGHGATASGQHVLSALRRQLPTNSANEIWIRLWKIACEAHLKRELNNYKRSMDGNFYFEADEEAAAASLGAATVAAMALGVGSALVQKVRSLDLDLVTALSDAIFEECQLAVEACIAPNATWLLAWLQAGADYKPCSSWLADEYNDGELAGPSRSPLGNLGRSAIEPGLLLEPVRLLLDHGDYGGLPFTGCLQDTWTSPKDAEDPVQVALRKMPQGELVKSQWQDLWKRAARLRLRWAIANAVSYDMRLLQDVLDLSIAVGLESDDLDEARLLVERTRFHEEDDRMLCHFLNSHRSNQYA